MSRQRPALHTLPEVAGGGLLDRRLFLRHGLALATAAAAIDTQAADELPWLHTPGAPFTPYGQPSPHERLTARRIGANRAVAGNGVSFTPLEDLEGDRKSVV